MKLDFGSHVWLDGNLIPSEEANINVMTHALHYSSSAFEGIRIYNYKPFKLEAHLNRLFYSAKVLGLDLKYNMDQLIKAASELVVANEVKNGYMRPLVWRGQGKTMVINGKTCPIHVLFSAWGSFEEKPKKHKPAGLQLQIARWRKGNAQTFPHSAKLAANYTIATIAKNEAESNGYDDSIFLDLNDNITECTTSNLFFIKGQELITPVADCFLDGITRQTVLNELAYILKLKTIQRHVNVGEVFNFDGAFTTGTASELTPVASITYNGQKASYDLPNPQIASLLKEYFKITR
jgi:branched-chain amino acid aminotransferase